MATLAIMPARGGSKRIKNKNIVDFCGRPLMAHALRAAKASGLFDLIHVSTDDPAIAAVATAEGFAPDFPREPRLADDMTPLFPVLRWVVEEYARRGRTFETICLLMPTAPLIEASDLAGAMALYHRHGAARPVIAVASFPCPVEWAMRLGHDGAITFVEPGKDQIRSQDLEPAYYDTGTFIIWPTAVLMAAGGAALDYIGYRLARWKAVDIDEHEDLQLAEMLFRGRDASSRG